MTRVGGTPEDIAKAKRSYTGQFLKPVLQKARRARASGAEAAE
jgi:excinuclease ABC subunit A